ncbi:hypothetical protein LTR37_006550 [Vermiconidia calcicola]|uniref:Uncharacterized protein n=1 Tax=Vermiconidia calcicola TaxID=1690605 RepID=A0ACC3NGZ0_9PEZI|nr:hypothetical protein LTR37_006550 [Vermiconidia calcicola]
MEGNHDTLLTYYQDSNYRIDEKIHNDGAWQSAVCTNACVAAKRGAHAQSPLAALSYDMGGTKYRRFCFVGDDQPVQSETVTTDALGPKLGVLGAGRFSCIEAFLSSQEDSYRGAILFGIPGKMQRRLGR